MAEPPVSLGAVHVTVRVALPEASVGAAGWPGAPTVAVTMGDHWLEPRELFACTRTS